jgi:Lon-like protease
MRQRGITTGVGAVLVTALTWLALHAPVPFIMFSPGPSYNTLGKDDAGHSVIQVSGAPATPSSGQLRFLTINLSTNLTMLEAVEGWIDGQDAVVPRALYFPPGQTDAQASAESKAQFAQSISSAQVAALNKLGYPPQVVVKEVAAGTPADGQLKPGDVIKTLDGVAMDSADTLVAALRAKPAGTAFAFGVTRGGTPMTITVKTVAGTDGVPRVGVTPDIASSAPFTISIPIENIGGPSAGLMLALGIIDTIEPADLTGGKIIAGTGSIDAKGVVGPIGGVVQKEVVARTAGATYFLTPKDNCADAVSAQQPGLTLVEVGTLDEALAALDDIRTGKQPPKCPGAN